VHKHCGEAVESHFGWRFAISGQTIAIDAPQDGKAVENCGACYLYPVR
jgi:hypothetical protein